MIEISFNRLRRKPLENYDLGPGDVLGLYIPGILGTSEENPPVTIQEKGGEIPALGFPVPILEGGIITLPNGVGEIDIGGMTITQAKDKIQRVLIGEEAGMPNGKLNKSLQPGSEKITITLYRKRNIRALVIREEAGGTEGVNKRGSGFNVDLEHGENDLLHALNETGGLPGLDAKNEVFIIRGKFNDGVNRDRLLAKLKSMKQPCQCEIPAPRDTNVTVIPIRFYAENFPRFKEEDIILETGDIVYIPSREREIFYTGGLLGGGQIQIPRDYDLDVLGAVSLAGGTIGSGGSGISQISGGGGGGIGAGGGRGGRGGGYGGIPPSRLIILRKTCDGGQFRHVR